jgi:hypothetical protein
LSSAVIDQTNFLFYPWLNSHPHRVLSLASASTRRRSALPPPAARFFPSICPAQPRPPIAAVPCLVIHLSWPRIQGPRSFRRREQWRLPTVGQADLPSLKLLMLPLWSTSPWLAHQIPPPTLLLPAPPPSPSRLPRSPHLVLLYVLC